MNHTDSKRLPQNTEGRYYTTDECDGCAFCASIAPENFDFDRQHNVYFVSKQPVNQEEDDYIREAMDDCPVDAIRMTDGNSQPGIEETTGQESYS